MVVRYVTDDTASRRYCEKPMKGLESADRETWGCWWNRKGMLSVKLFKYAVDPGSACINDIGTQSHRRHRWHREKR